MKILAMRQGTAEWFVARAAMPTASEFDSILTPAKLQPSKSAEKYMARLLAEWLLGHPIITDSSSFMERGKEMEPEARAAYEFDRDVAVRQVGFILRDDGLVGCSPDGLVGDDGGLEIKIPAIEQHVLYMLDPERLVNDYVGQVQGGLYLTGRDWWDVMSFSPELPPVIVRVEPDERYQEAIGPALEAFIKHMLQCRERLEPYKRVRDAAVAAVRRELDEQERSA